MGKTLSKRQMDIFEPRVVRRGEGPATKGPSRWLVKQIPEETTWKDTTAFVPPIKYGRVIKVYDGDTITVAGMLPYKSSQLYRFQVRLNGIDTPEMRTHDESEKAVAILAKEALSNLVKGEWVVLENTDNDKYGRLLADVWCGDLLLNTWMISNHYAVPYDGGTKHVPADWKVYYETGNMQQERSLYFDYEEY